MRRRVVGPAMVGALLTVLAGCGDRPDPVLPVVPGAVTPAAAVSDPGSDAGPLIQRNGTTPAATATVLLKWSPKDDDAVSVTARLRLAADGRTRITLSKAEITVVEALVAGDGTFSAWSPRTKTRCTGGQADAPWWMEGLGRLRQEILSGPLPVQARIHDRSATWTGATADLDADGQVLVVRDHSGTATYREVKLWDEQVRRATRCEWKRDDGTLLIILRDLQAVRDLPGERMALTIPGDIPTVSADSFFDSFPE